ncbi:MAG TPA: DNA polymerase III subunit gamma/tau [Candidatus Binatia bacterium]|nr:DNA polymerase III subunit gamma/tau [Candidatus Binatia bacterium]
MSYLVLARKWRPQAFEDIAGQRHITFTLQNAIRAGRIAHAYLFTGVRGIGKTTAARILAKALNCENGPTPDPCNRCSHCEEITNGRCIDVLEIDGASNRGIDEIRQIIENVRYQPAKCRFKIYIIDEVHQVTKDAFNALLKTLEEPPPSVKFILATTEPHRLPETILSRCQRYDFRRIPLREIVQRLADIATREGLRITQGALVLLAREADGSMRDAQSLLEQALACAEPARSDGEKTALDEALLQDVLGLADRQVLYDLSAAVIRGDPKQCLELVSRVVIEGRDLCRLSRELVEHFRNLLVARLSEPMAEATPLLDLPDQEVADLARQVDGLSVETLLDYFDFMAAGDEEVMRSPKPRFALETVLVKLATLPKTLPVAELLQRLESLEKKLSSGMERTTPAPPVMSLSKASAASPAVNRDEVWRSFVNFVGKEKKLLASHLAGATVLAIPPGELKIGVGERHHLSYLQDNDNLAVLKSLAKQFFVEDVALIITAAAAPQVESAILPEGELLQVAEKSDMVKEALRIFGGSVKAIRKENG